MCYFLLRYPVYYDRLQAEVDGAFPSGTDCMDLSRQAAMPYLNACMYVRARGLIHATFTDGRILATRRCAFFLPYWLACRGVSSGAPVESWLGPSKW